MLDTTVLILDQKMFHVYEPDNFEPSARLIFERYMKMGGRSYFSVRQNPTATELRLGNYKPRLTITKRFYAGIPDITMRIEFSAPKLVFGNNFDELQQDDFPLVIKHLEEKLKEMGVTTTKWALRNALVSSIHYSKNVVLPSGLIPVAIMKEIQKANISQRLDFNQTDYRNGGHGVKFRTNSYEIAFYDKIKDMQQAKVSKKRAIEQDSGIQIRLFEEMEKTQRYRYLEVIRMEIRLNQRQKIVQMLDVLNCKVNPTFENLFKKDIAQKVLLHYLDEVENSIPKSFYYEVKSAKDFIAGFMVDNPKEKVKSAILAYGFHNLLKDLTTREIRQLFKRTHVNTWYRFIKQMNSFTYSKSNSSLLEPIRNTINEFEPLKTADFGL